MATTQTRRSPGSARLFRLSDLDDFEVADWDPDIRGWNLVDETGDVMGEVDELIVDPDARKVRYLDVDFASSRRDGDRHVLVPIGMARLNEDAHQVVLQGVDRVTLSKVPAYGGQAIDRDYEMSLRTAYGADTASTDDFYAHKHFDENRFHGSRD